MNDKGVFPTLIQLQLTYPVGKDGWFARVGVYTYLWDISLQQWINRTGIADDSYLLNGHNGSYYLDERNHTRVINTYTTDTIITSLNRIVKVDCTLGNIIITLPTSVGFIGKIDISKIDTTTNKVIVTPFLGQTIWGETTQEIVGKNDNITIIADGTNWIII